MDEEHEYYHRYREDEENYYDVVDELKQELTKKNISFKLDVTDAFDSPGYECSVLSIAYILFRYPNGKEPHTDIPSHYQNFQRKFLLLQ